MLQKGYAGSLRDSVMASNIYYIRLFGVALIVIGVLLGGWGFYQDYTAPSCSGPIQPSEQNPASGGCEDPGLMEQFGGVTLTLIGIAVLGISHVILW